ncbi:hypothetical protein H2200_008312 [Cladophialophora chaetospira]|uniref:Uncharacterized protein n=1 Tax=Cladophialophora chaetospira TaxID=386627 RepID=A0AA39CGC7_9EURO|nr:hypothetical protein H2200_008312 [Cladophialophora chaetospira]
MSTSQSIRPIVLILGAGPNIGSSIAKLFLSNGYRVALVARSLKTGTPAGDTLEVQGDLSKLSCIPESFRVVREVWGHPSVVVYNGMFTRPPVLISADDPVGASRTHLSPDDPLGDGFSLETFQRDMTVNATNALGAAQHAVEGFKALPATAAKAFFYTGNKLNVMPSPGVLFFGMGKIAAAHMIWECSVAYRDRGFKFYYTDERFPDGRATRGAMSGEARAKLYLDLVQNPEHLAWHHTFVKDVGYVDFREIDRKADMEGRYE